MTKFSNNDERFMRKCIELARKGQPHPNPYVGAVLVDGDGQVLSEGYHRKAGGDHAETIALGMSNKFQIPNSKFQNTTLYINLEPCCYFGRTPPCADKIIKSGIKKVVIAIKDPNPKINGKGIKKLREAGIAVKIGILKKEAEQLNEQFICSYTKARPFVALKIATTLDGKIAARSGDSKWITGEQARAYARGLRARHQAILVGINTVLTDNPNLGIGGRCMVGRANYAKLRDPLRVILDSKLRIPTKARALRDQNVIIATTNLAPKSKIKQIRGAGFKVWVLPKRESKVSLKHLLAKMRAQNIISVFVEGGGAVASSFLKQKLIDKVYWFLAPKIIGDERALPSIKNQNITKIKDVFKLKNVLYQQLGRDILAQGYLLFPTLQTS
jgi:diaminohydroxyphosphoribosylaminopyrimidine deaminase/5-amino-6-(5-phosphoribosylamino)uracil reductase